MSKVDQMVNESTKAYKLYKKVSTAGRAKFLRQIADEIENLGDKLIETASRESNLPLARLQGERGRTCNQLRMFADIVEDESWREPVIDTAIPDRQPLPKPDLRRILQPIGPVVVFGASNFPLAFSTAGGDTASALASGCPVILKGHPAHPTTSLMVAGAIGKAITVTGMPASTFQHIEGGVETGQELVAHPGVKAVAFTGSFNGGMAIYKTAFNRPVPIPVFLEMGSVNPIFILPLKAEEDPESLAKTLAGSVLLGAGQFCTNPGLLFIPNGVTGDAIVATMKEQFENAAAEKMLHGGISWNYYDALEKTLAINGVKSIVKRKNAADYGNPALAETSVENWIKSPDLQEEVFGPFTLLVRYSTIEELNEAAALLNGQLTSTLLGVQAELESNIELISLLTEKSGRVIFSGVPTGVEVTWAMTHGGPFPATTDSRNTSVGAFAIKRFARPVSYQSAPQLILPEILRNENPKSVMRLVNGKYSPTSIT